MIVSNIALSETKFLPSTKIKSNIVVEPITPLDNELAAVFPPKFWLVRLYLKDA